MDEKEVWRERWPMGEGGVVLVCMRLCSVLCVVCCVSWIAMDKWLCLFLAIQKLVSIVMEADMTNLGWQAVALG